MIGRAYVLPTENILGFLGRRENVIARSQTKQKLILCFVCAWCVLGTCCQYFDFSKLPQLSREQRILPIDKHLCVRTSVEGARVHLRVCRTTGLAGCVADAVLMGVGSRVTRSPRATIRCM